MFRLCKSRFIVAAYVHEIDVKSEDILRQLHTDPTLHAHTNTFSTHTTAAHAVLQMDPGVDESEMMFFFFFLIFNFEKHCYKVYSTM